MPLQPNGLLYANPATTAVVYLKPFFATVRVSTDLSGWKRPEPSVHVQLRGGTHISVFETGRLQVDVRHETMDATVALANQVRARLFDMPLRVTDVVRAREYVGMQMVADADDKPRVMMLFDVALKGTGLPPSV